MIRTSIAIAVLAGAVVAVLLTPVMFAAGERRALANWAVRLGAMQTGAALLQPLAKAGDAVAQNNLGVLFRRGIGEKRDPIEAARLLNLAASAGLARAQLNLLLSRAPCDTSQRNRTIAALQGFARAGDRRAASFAIDCLGAFIPFGTELDETRQMLEMADIATSAFDPDEELKAGWLLLERVRRLRDYGSEAEPVRRRVAQAAARCLFLAAGHGRAAAYEGLSRLAADAGPLLAGDAIAARVVERSPAAWVETAAQAGHPRSRCVVGVALATQLSAANARASDADRDRLAGLFQTCLKDRDPRQVILKDGREQTIGHYRPFDVWMQEDAFLVMPPQYDNYDHDLAAQDDAVRRIVALAGKL